MRAGFIIELVCDAPPDDVLRRVLDLRAHSRVIPLTRVTPEVAADQLAVGTVFVARTSVGPVGFDDPMRVDQLSFRPATATIVKLGKVIRGAVCIRVDPTTGGSRMHWDQSVDLPWLPQALQPAAARVLRGGYRRIIRRLIEF